MVWSDECSVELGSGRKREWVFRTPYQKWEKEMIQPYNKSKAPSVMVWGGFYGKVKTNLVRMRRDPEAPRGGYSAESYLGVLEDQVEDIMLDGDLIFMQDNARVHTAIKVRDWLREHGIIPIDWPPYSPDLNPIEHLWRWIKEKAFELNPDIKNRPGSMENKLDELYATLERAWELIPKHQLKALYRSMVDRCEAVIEADGWYTKY